MRELLIQIIWAALFFLPYSVNAQRGLSIEINRKNWQMTINKDLSGNRSAGVLRNNIIVRIVEENNSVDTLFVNPTGCSQYHLEMNEDDARLTVYTTPCLYEHCCCLEDLPKPKTDEFEMKFVLDFSKERIRGKFYYYPENRLRNFSETDLSTFPYTMTDWYTHALELNDITRALEWNDIPLMIAWFYHRGYITDEIIFELSFYQDAFNKKAVADSTIDKSHIKEVNSIIETFRIFLPYLDMELREEDLNNFSNSLRKLYE